MKPSDFEGWLQQAIELARMEGEDEDPIRRVETYREVGILTTDHGLVVQLQDGSEIQVTLVRSRAGWGESGDEGDA